MKPILPAVVLVLIPGLVFAQQTDSLLQQRGFTGAIAVTNNGISLIPTFSLAKPAVFFDIAMRKKRLSFEPWFTFALEDAKPWYFIFWLRYKLVESRKYRLGAGFHPSVVFVNGPPDPTGLTSDNLTAVRFFVGELTPVYPLTKNASVGLYYLYSHGLSGGSKNTHFIVINGNLMIKSMFRSFYLRVSPQLYFVTIYGRNGYCATSTFTLATPNFPVALFSTINQKIRSAIASDDFIWNLSVAYSY